MIRKIVRRHRARFERVLKTSQEIDRLVAHRLALGEQLRPGYFGGPGSDGDVVAAAALLAAGDGNGAADPTELARIVAAAAFSPQLDRESVLLEISVAAVDTDAARDASRQGKVARFLRLS